MIVNFGILLLCMNYVTARDNTRMPAERTQDHRMETGLCQGTTLTSCPDFTFPEACLLMGCRAVFPPHTQPNHRQMCYCESEMKDCKKFKTNYECEYLAGCDWVYDFNFGEVTESPTGPNIDRGIDFDDDLTSSPTSSPTSYLFTGSPNIDRGIDFDDDLTSYPTSSPTSSPTSYLFTGSPNIDRGIDFDDDLTSSPTSPLIDFFSTSPTPSPTEEFPANTLSTNGDKSSIVHLVKIMYVIPVIAFLLV